MPESTLSSANVVEKAPPAPRAAIRLQPIRKERRRADERRNSPTAMVPLFLAALPYLAGIALTRCLY
ncbi:MAG TPA: hypothetical protein VIM62_12275, partial [Acidobacteriaceae bacterium]